MSWTPLLVGAEADRARAALAAIADELATQTDPIEDLALFWSYVAPVLGDAYAAHHDAALERLPSVFERGVRGPALYNGLAGLGWTIAHCADGADEILDLIDARLVEALREPRWLGYYDLIGGLVGIAVYFFERGPDVPLAKLGLAAIAGHLEQIAERTGELVTWHSPVELVPPAERERNPTGWYNCGVAHGVPGVIAVLARLGHPLCEGAIRWQLAQRTPDPSASRFPTLAQPDHSSTARTAWCYGDPGVLAVLWNAEADRPSVEALMREALARPVSRTGIVDTGVCHGTVGLAHIANRMFHATGDDRFAELARRWYLTTLAITQPLPTPDFLDGRIGLGLALAAAIAPIDPDWDRLLLVDLPIRGAP